MSVGMRLLCSFLEPWFCRIMKLTNFLDQSIDKHIKN